MRMKRSGAPDLDDDDVLAWADAFFARTGTWPTAHSGPDSSEAPGETWLLIKKATSSVGASRLHRYFDASPLPCRVPRPL